MSSSKDKDRIKRLNTIWSRLKDTNGDPSKSEKYSKDDADEIDFRGQWICGNGSCNEGCLSEDTDEDRKEEDLDAEENSNAFTP